MQKSRVVSHLPGGSASGSPDSREINVLLQGDDVIENEMGPVPSSASTLWCTCLPDRIGGLWDSFPLGLPPCRRGGAHEYTHTHPWPPLSRNLG